MRKEGPMIVMALSALAVVFSAYFHLGQQLGLEETLNQWYNRSIAIAVGVGMINVAVIHANIIKRRRDTWPFSVWLMVVMFAFLLVGLFQKPDGPIPQWIISAVVVPMDGTLYGMVAFFITAAAYRAFRVRTKEATVLMAAAVIVMLGQAPIGDVIIDGWGRLTDWIFDVPVTAAYRGIELGAYIGAFATALRILLGLERAHMGGAQ